MQQMLATSGLPRLQLHRPAGVHGDRGGVPRAEQPDRDRLRGDPVGILSRGEVALQIETHVPREFIIILQGILIMSVVITYQIAKRRLAARQLQRAGAAGALEDSAASRGASRAWPWRIADMPLTDTMASRCQILAARTSRIRLPDRTRRSVQRAIGHREHRPGRLDRVIRDRHRRVGGPLLHGHRRPRAPVGTHPRTLGGSGVRPPVRRRPRDRHGHVQGGSHRVGRRDQPRGDRFGAVPVSGVLRAGDAVDAGRPAPDDGRHPAPAFAAMGVGAGVRGLITHGASSRP